MHLITITTVLLFLPAMVFSAPLAKGQNGGIVVGAVDCQKSLNKCRINPDANRSTWYVAATSFVVSWDVNADGVFYRLVTLIITGALRTMSDSGKASGDWTIRYVRFVVVVWILSVTWSIFLRFSKLTMLGKLRLFHAWDGIWEGHHV